MKTFILLASILFSSYLFAHGGDDGPSSLEDEFSKLSHIHLPINYSTLHGLSFGYPIGGHQEEAHEEHEEHDEQEEIHSDETGFEIDIHPVMFGGHDKFKRLVSLEESQSPGRELQAANPTGPYLFIENKKWDLGFGMEGDVHLPNPLFTTGVGISYLKGKNYYSLRRLNSKNEKRAALKLPTSPEFIKGWRVGDQVSYASKGSLIFNVFVGIEPFIHVGPEYIHSGSYRVKILLESENILEIQIMSSKSNSIGVEGNAVALNADAMLSKGKLETLVYEFNLTNPESYEAIKFLFKGRLDLTNKKMIQSNGEIRVRTSLQNFGSSFSGNFGLPVLYLNGGGSGVYQNSGTISEVEEGETHHSKIFSTTLMKERFTRGTLSKHKWENLSITSTIVNHSHEDEKSSIISSIFSWSFSKDVMRTKLITRKLKKIAGLLLNRPELGLIKFPASDLGYLKADLTISLNGKDILTLLNTKHLKSLKKAAFDHLKKDMLTQGHEKFCRSLNFDECFSYQKGQIEAKHRKISSLVDKIEKKYEGHDLKKVTKSLSSALKELFKSKYLLGAFTASRPEITLALRIEGEKVRKSILNF